MLNALFGLSYGGIIASAYIIIKLTGAKGGVNVACVSALVIFLIHLLIWPKLTFQAFGNKKNLLRGITFGLTQIFLFKAQSVAPTSTMLIASIAGALAGSWFGRLILKEHPSWNEVIAMIIAVGGSLIGTHNFLNASIWAALGGLVQGLSGVIARSLMRGNVSRRGSVGTGFFMLSLTTFIVLLINKDLSSISDLKWWGILAAGGAAVISQYAFFQLYKLYSTQKATVFTLLRAPWGVAIESVFLNSGVTALKVLSSIIVFAGAIIAIPKPKKNLS